MINRISYILKQTKKVNGFTTMELSIVLLMSGIIATMAYGGYNLLQKQYYSHQKINDEALSIQQLVYLFKKDVENANTVSYQNNTLICTADTNKYIYQLESQDYILRTSKNTTDTFYVSTTDLVAHQSSIPNLIDHILVTLEYKDQEYQLAVHKQYDNRTLFELSQQREH